MTTKKKKSDSDLLKEDFRNFLYFMWNHLRLPPPTPVQYDIGSYLQDEEEKRKIIQGFRGVGKSWITSVFVCWLLYKDPQIKILVVSAGQVRADEFSVFTKNLIEEVPLLHHLKPRKGQRDSNISFDVGPARSSHAPSVKSIGVTGAMTGSRANVIIADDVESLNNSGNQANRDKLNKTISEFESILSPKGDIIYLGTPQTEESIYKKLEKEGYNTRIWPARIPDAAQMERYGHKLSSFVRNLVAKLKVGSPVDPERFDEEELRMREAKYARSGFNLQFMLDTSTSDTLRFPLKLSDFIVEDLDIDKAPNKLVWSSGAEHRLDEIKSVGKEGDYFYKPMFKTDTWSDYDGSVLSIDPSGRGKDELGYAVVKHLNGMLFVLECGGLQGGYDDVTLNALANIAKRQKVNAIIIESNFGDGMFTKLLTPIITKIHPCAMEEVRHNKQKEKRIIDTLEPLLNQHRIIIDKTLVTKDCDIDINNESSINNSLCYQLANITQERGALRHDDRLDALSIAIAYWTDMMSTNIDNAQKEKEEEEFDKYLREFVAGFDEEDSTNFLEI